MIEDKMVGWHHRPDGHECEQVPGVSDGQGSLVCGSPWGFSRQEYWSGFPCPPPGDLPNPGIKPGSPALQADSLTSEPPGLRKVMTNPDSILKSRDITLPTKVHLVKAMVFPLLVMYRYESRTIKKAEN